MSESEEEKSSINSFIIVLSIRNDAFKLDVGHGTLLEMQLACESHSKLSSAYGSLT